MTTVTLLYNRDRELIGYRFAGHAGAGDKGEDIVCASLSMLAINTANALESLTETPVQIVADEKEATLDVILQESPDERAATLLQALELACRQLQEDPEYHPYVTIVREEID